jgi:hypothetical protein
MSESKNEVIWIHGFKAMDKNMRCKDVQYEIGKTYTLPLNEGVKVTYSGYHFSKKLDDTCSAYDFNFSSRYFRIRAKWILNPNKIWIDLHEYGSTLATEEIEILSEILPEEYVGLAIRKGFQWIDTSEHYEKCREIGFKLWRREFLKAKLKTYDYENAIVDWLIDTKAISDEKVHLTLALAQDLRLSNFERLQLIFGQI